MINEDAYLCWEIHTIDSLEVIASGHTFPRVCGYFGGFIPCGRVIQAPSTIAWASSRSLHSAARAAALSASQISLRPSKAGAVSQNSSLLLLSCPSVIGYSLFHFGRSFLRGSFRPGWKYLKKTNIIRVALLTLNVTRICDVIHKEKKEKWLSDGLLQCLIYMCTCTRGYMHTHTQDSRLWTVIRFHITGFISSNPIRY